MAAFTAQLKPFQRLKRRVIESAPFDDSWICKAGLWPDDSAPKAVVLKLLKRHWSLDLPDSIVSTSGIFFSIWVDDEAISRGGIHYNLHAFKLRELRRYRLESRKFAEAFRAKFRAVQTGWPNVSTEFGPQTLFQGFAACPPEGIEAAAFELAQAFFPLATIIEELLAGAAKPVPSIDGRKKIVTQR